MVEKIDKRRLEKNITQCWKSLYSSFETLNNIISIIGAKEHKFGKIESSKLNLIAFLLSFYI